MKNILLLSLIAFTLFFFGSGKLWSLPVEQKVIVTPVATSTPVVKPTTTVLTINDYITIYATKHNIPEAWLRNLGWCESRLRQSAVGDGGNAIGMFQYWRKTWNSMSKEYGVNLNINSYHDQIRLTAWALSKGYGYHWTCDYKTGYVREEYKHLFD